MSDNKHSFLKQATILAVASLIVRFIGFLYRIPLTNLIGDEGNGIYAAGYNLYTLFFIMSSAGLPAAISKMVSERIALKQYRNAHEVFKVSLLVSSVSGAFAFLILFFGAEKFTQLIKYPSSYYSILTLSPTVLIVAVMAVFRGYFQGMKKTTPTAISQIVEQIFNAVFSVYLAFVLISRGVEFGAAGGTGGTGIGALAGLIVIVLIYYIVSPAIKKRALLDTNSEQFESRKDIAKILLLTATPIIIGTAIFSLTNIIDMTMVKDRLAASNAFESFEIDALYGQLTGKYVVLTTLPVSIATAFATVSVPTIASSYILKDIESVQRKINVAIRLSMILSIPAAVGIGVLSDQFLLLLFPKFPEGGMLLKIGAISIIFLALAQIVTGILQGTGKVFVPAITAFLGAIVKIPLNYFLLANPKLNILGAVISTIGCYAVASIIDLIIMCKTTKVKLDYSGAFIKPLISSVVMGFVCFIGYYCVFFIYPSNTIACIFSIAAGIAAYFGFMVLIKGFRREDLLQMPFGAKIANTLHI